MKHDDRRKFLRFKDPDRGSITLSYTDEQKVDVFFTALIVNESLNGMACVFVGKEPIRSQVRVVWHETETIRSPCKVVRCRELEEDVYFLALRLDKADGD